MSLNEELYSKIKETPYMIFNDGWIKFLNGDASSAIMLGKLINLHKYLSDCKKLEEDNSFFLTLTYITNTLGYSPHVQRRALSILEQKELVECKLIGFPQRRKVKLLIENIIKINDISVSKQKKKYKDKKQYYEDLNNSLYGTNMTPELLNTINTNIKLPMLEFMYAWSITYESHSREKFNWTPVNFGKLRQYFVPAYVLRKPFDYRRLRDYTNKVERGTDMSILGFIDWDRCEVEESPQHLWEVKDYYNIEGFGVKNG
jgi:hypothetical protein